MTFDWYKHLANSKVKRHAARACFCVGPQNGEPLCPCQMRVREAQRADGVESLVRRIQELEKALAEARKARPAPLDDSAPNAPAETKRAEEVDYSGITREIVTS